MAKNKKSKFSYVGIILIAIVLGIIVGCGIFISRVIKTINTKPNFTVLPQNTYTYSPQSYIPTPEPETVLPGETVIPSETEIPGETAVPPSIVPDHPLVAGEDYLNILLVGYDSSEYRESTGKWTFFRTDTLILCTVYFKTNKVILTSIPRDTRVAFPFYNFDPEHMDKINSVPSRSYYAGVDTYQAMMDTVSRLFGNAPVNYYFAVDMDVFEEVIDALGGIEYNVDVDVKYGDQIHVHKGQQLLNGKQALQYVQYRGTATADIGRTERQRKFLISAFQQLKSLDKLTKLPEIYKNIIKDKIFSNLTYGDILWLANYAASDIEPSNIKGQVFPGFFQNLKGISYWGVNEDTRKYLLLEMFGIPYDKQN